VRGRQGASQAVLDCQALAKAFGDVLGAADGGGNTRKRARALDVVAALAAYDKARVGPASAVVLANRDMGPTYRTRDHTVHALQCVQCTLLTDDSCIVWCRRVLRYVDDATSSLPSIEAKYATAIRMEGFATATRNYGLATADLRRCSAARVGTMLGRRAWIAGQRNEIEKITRNYHHMTLSSIAKGALPVTVAAAQFFSGPDEAANAKLCVDYMRQAAAKGAKLLVLPENSQRERDFFENGKPSRTLCWDRTFTVEASPFVATLAAEAKALGMYVAVGVDVRGETAPDVHIASVLLGPDGTVVGVHRKTVLWDYEYATATRKEWRCCHSRAVPLLSAVF
jgi:hypothetical protein